MMKKTFRIILLVLIVVTFRTPLSGKAADGRSTLPFRPDTLRILAVGNSFSDDATEYIPSLLESAGIHNVIIGRLYIGGCSLQRHCKEYEAQAHNYMYYKSGADNRWNVQKNATLLDGVKDEPWDIITMQEQSGYSGIYDNIHTWLPQLMEILKRECTNPDVRLVWHETWAYAKNAYQHPDFPKYGNDQDRMLEGIRSCVQRLQDDFDIETVIPCGEAIQLARASRLNNVGEVPADTRAYDLTRDGYHLSRQFGRYLAACTWFEMLVAPTVGVPLSKAHSTLRDTEYSLSPKDARLCRRIAVKACKAQRAK